MKRTLFGEDRFMGGSNSLIGQGEITFWTRIISVFSLCGQKFFQWYLTDMGLARAMPEEEGHMGATLMGENAVPEKKSRKNVRKVYSLEKKLQMLLSKAILIESRNFSFR